MRDYEYDFVLNLHEKLKQKVNAGIHCKVIYDRLQVSFINDGVKWTIEFNYFSDRIRNGWTSEYAAHECVERYKQEIMHRYFY